jgi:hypothetical protein
MPGWKRRRRRRILQRARVMKIAIKFQNIANGELGDEEVEAEMDEIMNAWDEDDLFCSEILKEENRRKPEGELPNRIIQIGDDVETEKKFQNRLIIIFK